MPQAEFTTHSAEETIELGRSFGKGLSAPALILLSGDLGAGKTTLTKGIISGLGAAREEDVLSPTFTLVHVFQNQATQTKVYHVDLYRIDDFHGFETLGIEDAFDEPAVMLIEWAERLHLRTEWPVFTIRLEHVDEESRRLVISSDHPVALAAASPNR